MNIDAELAKAGWRGTSGVKGLRRSEFVQVLLSVLDELYPPDFGLTGLFFEPSVNKAFCKEVRERTNLPKLPNVVVMDVARWGMIWEMRFRDRERRRKG